LTAYSAEENGCFTSTHNCIPVCRKTGDKDFLDDVQREVADRREESAMRINVCADPLTLSL
jgi:hypothetical protein